MEAIWYDAIILLVLVFCVWRGAAKGFAWQVATIGAIILCFVFAEKASLLLAPVIQVDPPLNRWIAMFALYIGASFVSFAAARMIKGTLKRWEFEEYDTHLGAVFGFVKGVAFALVITFFAVTLSESLRGRVLASYSGYSAGQILVALHPVMPDEFHGVIDPYIEKLGHTVVHEHDDHSGDDNHDHAHDGHDHGQAPTDEFGPAPWGDSAPESAEPPPPSEWGSDQEPGGFGPPPSRGDQPAPFPSDSAPRPDAPSAVTDIERIVQDIPDDLKDSAIKAWQNTSPEDRDELLANFQGAIPGVIEAVSQEWSEGKPPAARSAEWRDQTLREIAEVYSKDSRARQELVRKAETALRGVPDHVASGVIEDWHADLFTRDPQNDPDPATDLRTRFDERIRRQLDSFGISLDRLRAELRDRLQGETP